MKRPEIQGVIFDLDGTLYTMRGLRPLLALSLWRSVVILRRLSGARRAVRQHAFADAEGLRNSFFGELSRKAGVDFEQAQSWYDECFLPSFVELLERRGRRRPGLISFLGRLRTEGILLAVVSDFPRVDDRLRAIGVPPEAFHVTASAEEVGALKPSPRAFTAVCSGWGLDPERVLVVGDRPDFDADGAHAAGMPFLGLAEPGGDRGGRQEYVPWRRAMDIIATRTGIGVER